MNIPGLTVAVTRNDSVIYTGSFGVRNVDTQEQMKPQYIFHWASVSKTLVATAIMQLTERGKISLDKKLTEYLPYFSQKESFYKEITIRQVLNHTSGIDDVQDYEWDKPQYDTEAPERYVRSLSNDNMLFNPGTDWSYSNTAYNILGDLITKVSGIPFETYIKENIFQPLEMENTSFIYPEIQDSLRVTPHVWKAKVATSSVYPYNRIHAPSGCLNSSVLEMTHYAMANLHRGEYKGTRILSDSSYNLLWSNSVNIEDKPKVGLSWFLNEYKGLKIVEHDGVDLGFASDFVLVPEKNISVSVVSNYDRTPTIDIAYAVLDYVLGHEAAKIKWPIGIPFVDHLRTEGLDNAITFYTKMKQDSLTNKLYLFADQDGLSWTAYQLMKQGFLKEAIILFKYNLKETPESSDSHYHLGVAYAKADSVDLARIYLNEALGIDPSNKYCLEELKKLKK
jgi:CubicO group peptidase (beta-lactamase class C family)